MPPNPLPSCRFAIIGAGPAGLMAAEQLAAAGHAVEVFDAMPSVGRKFLMAGKGGMNITHSEPLPDFIARYGARADWLAPLLQDFGPEALRAWIHGLGVDTFIGSSGRVFPTEMKAAPLLRAWLHRLREAGVVFHVRHRWLGWTDSGDLRFSTPEGEVRRNPAATLLALGGASWPQLGSDAAWLPWLAARGVVIEPLQPANCGFDVGWSEHFRARFVGEPLKNVVARCGGPDGRLWQRAGECLISATGIEGGLIYALSAPLRELLRVEGRARLALDLLPDFSAERVATEVAHPRGARSLSSHLQSRLGLKGVKLGLLYECLGKAAMRDPVQLAAAIKALPLELVAPRPIAEAISTAGGIRIEECDANLMLARLPGVFVAGEMLDWEAPTGGYLLTACFATGRAAGQGTLRWLAGR
ncbi:TIGR03862 family flavoprotein [Uliginosibacterium sp. TH139]|uniref:TIGR03862 family flavoprotein n=1 Tax=Uliginosibacterium sp. TH139 TaxID=2067453 RepID=UPI000C79F26A|nr:TIGR03862 family flavoprotein [Uliginosibacterium sp. TH139]PLK50502.1 aminoacetone oxidase family FAD-binding enzyme [Uliginosibacterium sp. TH139]